MYQLITILGFFFIVGLILLNLILLFFNFKRNIKGRTKRFFGYLWVYANYLYLFILFAKSFIETAVVENFAWNAIIIDKGPPPDILDILYGVPSTMMSYFVTYFPHWAIAMVISIIIFILINDDKRRKKR